MCVTKRATKREGYREREKHERDKETHLYKQYNNETKREIEKHEDKGRKSQRDV